MTVAKNRKMVTANARHSNRSPASPFASSTTSIIATMGSPSQKVIELEVGKRWGNKPRSCYLCQTRRRRCTYLDPTTCSTCFSIGIECSGPVRIRRASVAVPNIHASTTGGKLAHSVLSFALKFHLIEEYQNMTTNLPVKRSHNHHSFTNLISALVRSDQKLRVPEIEEIAGLSFMFMGVQVTCHSSVIGHELSKQYLQSNFLTHHPPNRDIQNFTQLGEARNLAKDSLEELLVSKVEQFVEKDSNPTARALSVLFLALESILQASNDSRVLKILQKLMAPGIIKLRKGRRATGSEVHSVRHELKLVLDLSADMQFALNYTEVSSSGAWTLSFLLPSPLMLSPLPEFNSEDLISLITSESWAREERIRLSVQLENRIFGGGVWYTRCLQTRLMQLLDGRILAYDPCEYCWTSIRHIRERNQKEIDRILLHPLYRPTLSSGVWNVVTTFLNQEIHAGPILFVCYQHSLSNGPDNVEAAIANISDFLRRLSEFWDLLDNIVPPSATSNDYRRFKLLGNLTSSIHLLRGEPLSRWTKLYSNHAIRLLHPLRIASFFSLEAGQLVTEIEMVLNTLEDTSNEDNTLGKPVGKTLGDSEILEIGRRKQIEIAKRIVNTTVADLMKPFEDVNKIAN